jgi:hypothetical protein
MLAKRWEEPIMGKSVEKVAKSGEKWGRMWITIWKTLLDRKSQQAFTQGDIIHVPWPV